MKTLSLKISVSTFTLLLTAAGGFCAQPATSAARPPAPLGLLRLQDTTKPGQPASLATNTFAVDNLAAGVAAGASKLKKDGVDLLSLEAGREWSRALRGSARQVAFISFQLHGSPSTIVDIGGARLGLTASPVGNYLQLMFDDSATGTLQWKSLNFHLGAGNYGGKHLAALPTLTVRLDPDSSTWDIYLGSRLLAENLPMITANKGQRQFLLRAGSEGAWLTGLVMADENPLYEDENENGIDDIFEKQKRSGRLLAKEASVAERSQLAREWIAAQRTQSPPALFVRRPRSDDQSR